MDAVDVEAEPFAVAPPAGGVARRTELVLDAVKTALADPREHRLFASGKLPGLFPARHGPAADAALYAIKEGLFETVRTEAKGRLVVEWVRAAPRGVGFVHDHDSPKAVLKELRTVLGETRAGVPVWMADARTELAAVAAAFDANARALTDRLDELTRRVDAALRRLDLAGPHLPDGLAAVVPWGEAALEYLDRRASAGAAGDCPLGELFHAVREHFPALAVPDFHDGLRRLHDTRAVRLTTAHAGANAPEFAVIVGAELCHSASR